jgi:AraC family transcriptional regulator, regulatory protein of adaptative response / methylated-DNA-[protein]-cysteine methyltransferase
LLRARLAQQSPVTAAIYAAGFSSSGHFYESSRKILGMTPKAYRAGGASESIRFALGECSLGSILVAATERGVCAILLGDDPAALTGELERLFSRAKLCPADRNFEKLVAQVVGMIERPRTSSPLPLDIRGTAFQERVWRVLTEIPAGSTRSYAEIAESIGNPKAVRAVANACAKNVLAVAVPCHRVVRRDGTPSGYRWGVERKRELLDREAPR